MKAALITEEQLAKIKTAFIDIDHAMSAPFDDVANVREALAILKSLNLQEPLEIPEFPEPFWLADLDYGKDLPESWDIYHRQVWQRLEVCQRNKIQLHKYACQLRGIIKGIPLYAGEQS